MLIPEPVSLALVLVGIPGLWYFAYMNYTTAGRKHWLVRTLLSVMAVAAATAVVAALTDFLIETEGATQTLLHVLALAGTLIVLAPFLLGSVLDLIRWLRRISQGWGKA